MNVLVYGAGVIGTLYAARLQQAGHRVTVLARRTRLADIRREGLVLQEIGSANRSSTRVDTVEQLDADAAYDLALISVRRDQIDAIVPMLAANRRVPTMLFMLNNPMGSSRLVDALGQARVLLGFPGAGGARDGSVVRYALVPQQSTTLAEWSGQRSARVRALAHTLRVAGFPTSISRNMDAWLKTHALFVTAVSGAIYRAGGNCRQLSESHADLQLMTHGVREGFAAVRRLGLPVTPLPLSVLFNWMPEAYAVHYWRRFFASALGDAVFGRHARAASGEMRELADDCRGLLERAGGGAPALLELYGAIDTWIAEEARG